MANEKAQKRDPESIRCFIGFHTPRPTTTRSYGWVAVCTRCGSKRDHDGRWVRPG